MAAQRPPRFVPLAPAPNRLGVPQFAPPARSEPAGAAVVPDESLLEGCRRRLREWGAELRSPPQRAAWLTIGVLFGLLIYSYWPGLMNARSGWSNPQYSHGGLVPLCTVALFFWWRRPLGDVTASARLAGLAILAGSFLIRLVCAHYRIVTIDMYTFVPALAGVVLMAGGWQTFRWAWAPILMLIFMFPLPDEATRYLLGPLQTLATMMSTFAIQTLGYEAYREGNRIILGEEHVLGVVDACSGLRMLTIFIWLCVLLALVGNGDWWENVVIIGSAVPIALIVNSVRITLTGIMYTINPEIAEKIFHDWAGYFMMPLAIGLLYAVQSILRKLVISESAAPSRVDMSGLGGMAVAGRGRALAGPAEAKRFPALAGEPGTIHERLAPGRPD